MRELCWAFRVGICCIFFACANLPTSDEDVSGLDIAGKQPGVVGTPNSNSTSNPNSPATTPSTQAVIVIDPLSTASAVSIRSRSDPSKCITRPRAQAAENDPLTLAACANDVRQAFVYVNGYYFVDSNYVIGMAGSINYVNPQPATLVLRSSSNVAAYIEMSGAAVLVRNNYLGPHGYLIPQNDSMAIGTPIVANPNYGQSADANWDITGVGTSASRGAIMTVEGSINACMAKSGSSIKLVACDANQSAQRWLLPQGDLYSEGASPGFVVGGMNGNSPILVFSSTASNTSSNNQGWCTTSQGIQYAGSGITGGGSYYLSGDTSSASVILTKGQTAHSLWIGGTAKTVFR